MFLYSVTTSPDSAGNDDFHSETVDITFAPGETGPKPIPVTLTDDKDVEPNEKFTVTMTSSSPGVTVGEPATVMIKDNDKPSKFKYLHCLKFPKASLV